MTWDEIDEGLKQQIKRGNALSVKYAKFVEKIKEKNAKPFITSIHKDQDDKFSYTLEQEHFILTCALTGYKHTEGSLQTLTQMCDAFEFRLNKAKKEFKSVFVEKKEI